MLIGDDVAVGVFREHLQHGHTFQTSLIGNIGQHFWIANIAQVREIGLHNPFDHGNVASGPLRPADHAMGGIGVWRDGDVGEVQHHAVFQSSGLKRRRRGKVINIASIDGLRINPWQTYSYQASKAAVIHLTRRLAAELVKDNILVSGIAPGAFQSDMNKAARDHADAVGKNIPFPRIGTPEDMAGLAIFLAARAGDYIVGETIACDGGIVNASLPGNGIAP